MFICVGKSKDRAGNLNLDVKIFLSDAKSKKRVLHHYFSGFYFLLVLIAVWAFYSVE